MLSQMSIISDEQQLAVQKIVLEAGAELMTYWPGATKIDQSLLKTQSKSDGSPVSAADLASNRIILGGLAALFPEDGILSEETTAAADLYERPRLWIVDPLDGTKSFLNGLNDFSVLVSLCAGPTPQLGWLFFPAQNILCFAARGAGAIVNGEKVTVSKERNLRDKRVYIRNFEILNPELAFDRWMDSGYAMLSLAKGDFDGIIMRLLTHREWDLAAPTVLIEEAGGTVSDEYGQPIAYNCGGMQCRYFVASNGINHQELLAQIPK